MSLKEQLHSHRDASPSDNLLSDKYWAKKVSSLNTRNSITNQNNDRLDKLGGLTTHVPNINHKISDFAGRVGFGIETYRESRDSSFGNDDNSKDELKAINSSRSK